jgi:hypothetical protein
MYYVKFKNFKCVIVCVDLYGCKIWSLNMMHLHILNVSEKTEE